MDSRRDFLKKAALLAAGGGLTSMRKVLAIDPPQGSSYLDAEHVVILMQENRSFDQSYGTLRGVRGFNDPRAVTLPDGNPVWFPAPSKSSRRLRSRKFGKIRALPARCPSRKTVSGPPARFPTNSRWTER